MRRFASTFQMLRGTLVLFAGILTILLLNRRLHSHHWFGMVRTRGTPPRGTPPPWAHRAFSIFSSSSFLQFD